MIEFLFAITLGVGSVVLATISLGELAIIDKKESPTINQLKKQVHIPKEIIDNLPVRYSFYEGHDIFRYIKKTNNEGIECLYIAKNPDSINLTIKSGDIEILRLNKETNEYIGELRIDHIDILEKNLENYDGSKQKIDIK